MKTGTANNRPQVNRVPHLGGHVGQAAILASDTVSEPWRSLDTRGKVGPPQAGHGTSLEVPRSTERAGLSSHARARPAG
jgi:hypothetical protein